MQNRKSFTLIEMLIVVVIIGILAAALIPRLQSVQARARDTKRKADLHQIGTALAIYKEDNNGFQGLMTATYSVSDWIWAITSYRDTNAYQNGEGDGAHLLSIQESILPRYMTSIPFDSDVGGREAYGSADCSACEYGQMHGYAVVIDQKTKNSLILGARMESDGASSNYVSNSAAIAVGDSTPTYSSSIRIGSLSGNPQDAGDDQTIVGGVNTIQKYVCNTVIFSGDTTNNGSGSCTANKDGNDLRYVYGVW